MAVPKSKEPVKRKSIPYRFGDKHKAYMRRSRDCTYNVAEGSIRAGKTTDNIFAFAHELKRTKDKLHLASGSTLGNAKLNIGDANGFGLEHIFRGQCHWGKFKGNEALYIQGPSTSRKLRVVIFAGGGKADSYKKVRGNSYGMWIATEINLHHDSMIKECINRTAAAKMRKFFWDLNPDNPYASIYKDYIDKYAEKAAAGEFPSGYNYEHFTLFDNVTISKQRQKELMADYDTETIWYRRDILGERCAAEGVIYKSFADNPSKHIRMFKDYSEKQEWLRTIHFISIGIDFGGNRSLTTFVASAINYRFQEVDVVKDANIEGKKGDIDPDKLNKSFLIFYEELKREFPGIPILYIFADNEAQYLINGLAKACRAAGITASIGDSAKKKITDRVYCGNTLLASGRMRVLPECKLLIAGLKSAIWDPKEAEKGKDVRLDNFSSDIDILDAWEYSWERFMKKLLPESKRSN